MWTRYISIQVYRDAIRIENPAYLEKVEGEDSKYVYHVDCGNPSKDTVAFSCNQIPKAGDYIVKENGFDVYFVPQDVFVNKYRKAE